MGDLMAIKKGELLIDADQIYMVVSIEDGRIYYQTYGEAVSKVRCSIPVENLKMAGFRKLLSVEEIKGILKLLGEEGKEKIYDQKTINEIIWSNDVDKMVSLLLDSNKTMSLDPENNKKESELVGELIGKLAKEISFVLKTKKEEVEKDIKKRLKKALV